MPGVLPMVAALARRGIGRVLVATDAVDEARLVDGMAVSGVERLRQAVEIVQARRSRRRAVAPARVELVGGDRSAAEGHDADDGTAEDADADAVTTGLAARRRAGTRPVRGARPGRGATRPRGRPGRRSRAAADRTTRFRQDAARADDPGAAAAGSTSGRLLRRRSSRPPPARVPSASFAVSRRSERLITRCPTPRWSAAARPCRPAK